MSFFLWDFFGGDQPIIFHTTVSSMIVFFFVWDFSCQRRDISLCRREKSRFLPLYYSYRRLVREARGNGCHILIEHQAHHGAAAAALRRLHRHTNRRCCLLPSPTGTAVYLPSPAVALCCRKVSLTHSEGTGAKMICTSSPPIDVAAVALLCRRYRCQSPPPSPL